MSSAFCSLEDAFMELAPAAPKKEKKEKRRAAAIVEPMDGGAGAQPVDQIGVPPPPVPAAFQARAPTGGRVEAVPLGELFPLPGATAEPEEWQRAFMLQPSQMPAPTGAVPVNGAPTLWRQITPAASAAAAIPSATPLSTVPSNISERLDQLTRQLETLTGPTSMQGTAELFLFVGIGLLLLLAIDTLLRFASNVATGRKAFMTGGARMGRRWMIR
jgi:hypothetical protein